MHLETTVDATPRTLRDFRRTLSRVALVVFALASASAARPQANDRAPDARTLRIKLPYRAGSMVLCSQGNSGKASHESPLDKYAYDFALVEGTPVLAVAAGRVLRVEQDSYVGGATPEYGRFANFVWIDHGGGVFSFYAHLQPASSTLRPAQLVDAGQVIGKSGSTGFATGPHLHFSLTDCTRTSIPSRFVEVRGDGVPRGMQWYESQNDGTGTSAFAGDSRFDERFFEAEGLVLERDAPTCLFRRSEIQTFHGRVFDSRGADSVVFFVCGANQTRSVLDIRAKIGLGGVFELAFDPAQYRDTLAGAGVLRYGVTTVEKDGTFSALRTPGLVLHDSARDAAGKPLVVLAPPVPSTPLWRYVKEERGKGEQIRIELPAGVPISACGAGRVVSIGRDHTLPDPDARTLTIDHGQGVSTRYSGLAAEAVTVCVGEIVAGGQQLAASVLAKRVERPALVLAVSTNGLALAQPVFPDLGKEQAFGSVGTIRSDRRASNAHTFFADSYAVTDAFGQNGVATVLNTAAHVYQAELPCTIAGTTAETASAVTWLVRRVDDESIVTRRSAPVTDRAFRIEPGVAALPRARNSPALEWTLVAGDGEERAPAVWSALVVVR